LTGGTIGFISQPPTLAPSIVVPDSIAMSGLINSSSIITFTISESGGQQGIDNAVITLSDLSSQYGEHISANQFLITPSTFSIGAGSEQLVTIQVDLNSLYPGEYLGGLILTSENGNPIRIPFVLQIQFLHLYLPCVGK
jgi:hypothetical protein